MFSQTEKRVLSLIGTKELSIADLTKKFHNGRAPYGANNVLALTVRRIQAKCKINKLPWTIDGEGGGRHGRTVWKTRRTKMPTIRRIAYKSEPVLHVHRYICQIFTGKHTGFRYATNLKEVRDIKRNLKVGQILEVYKADHNFAQAYERTK